MEKIMQNIESIRKEKGIKQEVIAKILGISQSAYSNYVNRNNDITLSRLSHICEALDVTLIDVITYPDKYVSRDEIVTDYEKDATIKHLNSYISLLEKMLDGQEEEEDVDNK